MDHAIPLAVYLVTGQMGRRGVEGRVARLAVIVRPLAEGVQPIEHETRIDRPLAHKVSAQPQAQTLLGQPDQLRLYRRWPGVVLAGAEFVAYVLN